MSTQQHSGRNPGDKAGYIAAIVVYGGIGLLLVSNLLRNLPTSDTPTPNKRSSTSNNETDPLAARHREAKESEQLDDLFQKSAEVTIGLGKKAVEKLSSSKTPVTKSGSTTIPNPKAVPSHMWSEVRKPMPMTARVKQFGLGGLPNAAGALMSLLNKPQAGEKTWQDSAREYLANHKERPVVPFATPAPQLQDQTDKMRQSVSRTNLGNAKGA